MQCRACERWGERSTGAIGSHLPPVGISHVSAALEESEDGLGTEPRPAVRQRDRQRQGLMWLWCRKLPWSLWKHNSSTGDWQALTHTALSPVFRLSGFLLTETQSVSLGGRGSSYTFPPGGWSLSDPVRISQRFLKEVWVERCGVPVWKWLCNPKFPGAVLPL